jgi:hypothetical protein
MDTCRIFIRWLEAVDGVKHDPSEKVLSPSLSRGEDAREVMLESDRASEILAYIAKYHYASVEHISTALAWHTMMRTGSIHALDVGDYSRSDQYLEVRHRPDTGTSIKNKSNGNASWPCLIKCANSLTTGFRTKNQPSPTHRDASHSWHPTRGDWLNRRSGGTSTIGLVHGLLALTVPMTENSKIARHENAVNFLSVRRA